MNIHYEMGPIQNEYSGCHSETHYRYINNKYISKEITKYQFFYKNWGVKKDSGKEKVSGDESIPINTSGLGSNLLSPVHQQGAKYYKQHVLHVVN